MFTRYEPRTFRLVAFLLSVLIILPAQAQYEREYCPNYDGKIPPSLQVSANGWMNYDGELSLEKLRGHVVWLEFSFIACGGCQMMKPHLHGLQHRYGPDGLVVVEVNNGKVDTRDALAKELDHLLPNYPVLWDEDGKTCDAYGVTKYGTAYLIGADGKVIWGGNPLDLSIYDMWKLVYYALKDVDISALREEGDPLLAYSIVESNESMTRKHSPPLEEQAPVRYTLGWDFSICTSDNSMLIEGVRSGSPAALAGLAKGDTIVGIDDLILSEVPFAILKDKLHELEKSPDPVTLKIRRDEKTRDIIVAPRKRQ